jgi:predicted dehydrogenase
MNSATAKVPDSLLDNSVRARAVRNDIRNGSSTETENGEFRTGDANRLQPRLGFLGVGWIGRHRLEAIARSGVAQITAIADLSAELVRQARQLAPQATACDSLEQLLDQKLDGVVIATPSALHAQQAIAALQRGIAVFCQKPLARTAEETRAVLTAARSADVSLGVDLSYRHVSGIRKIQELCRGGALGKIYAVELVFHNAYGPDKAWFYDPKQSGGGCVIDLGIHLVDLALWCLGFPRVENVTSRMYAQGQLTAGRSERVEDYAIARIDLANGATVQLTCSWKLPAGCEAVISGAFYGTQGGAAFHNRDGSFYRFIAERFEGTQRRTLADEEEPWGGRAAVEWARQLAAGKRFDHQAEELARVAEVLDAIFERASAMPCSLTGTQPGTAQRQNEPVTMFP